MSSTVATRRSIVLKRRPRRETSAADFEMREDPIPHPAAREVLTRTIFLSIDPYMRGRLREQQTYAAAVQIGEVMTGETVGEVIASEHPGFAPGDVVGGSRGWQTHSVTPGDRLTKLDRNGPSPAMTKASAAIAISANGSNWLPWTTYVTGAYRGRC